MRISTAYMFQTGLRSLNNQQSDLMHVYQQMGSGRRMVTPADDPLGAAQAVNLHQSQAMNLRFGENREVLKRNLNEEESTLSAVVTALQGVKTRLLEVGNGTLSDADRNTLSEVLVKARENLIGLANTQDGSGQYLFSGSLGATAPFDTSTGVYVGDSRQRLVQADPTREIASSDIGSDIFARATPGAQSLLTLAAATNTGGAVAGAPVLYDSTAANFDASLRYEIVFTSATDYDFEVFDASGVSVDTGSGTLPAADSDGSHLLQLPGYGMQFKMSGVPATGDRFDVEPAGGSGSLNLFQTLDQMIASLKVPQESDPQAQAAFRNMLNSALQRIDVHHDNVLTVRASVGARLSELDALQLNGQQRNLGYAGQLQRLEDLNYYEASSRLELRSMALEAAALAFRKIQSASLFSLGQG